MDKLTVKGLDALDGLYEFDGASMMVPGTPESLTNREGHRMKVMAGVRMGELEDALAAGDNDVLVALAAIILARAGKRFDEERLWDAPIGSALVWEFEEAEEQENPPVAPPQQNEQLEQSEPREESGGASGKPTLVTPASDPSVTGSPGSPRSVTFGQETLAS